MKRIMTAMIMAWMERMLMVMITLGWRPTTTNLTILPSPISHLGRESEKRSNTQGDASWHSLGKMMLMIWNILRRRERWVNWWIYASHSLIDWVEPSNGFVLSKLLWNQFNMKLVWWKYVNLWRMKIYIHYPYKYTLPRVWSRKISKTSSRSDKWGCKCGTWNTWKRGKSIQLRLFSIMTKKYFNYFHLNLSFQPKITQTKVC